MPESPPPNDQRPTTTEDARRATDRDRGPLLIGSRVGHYTIRQVLGEGGFGVVYQAEQLKPVRRMVAIKVIKHGMDTRAVLNRFDAERQALAMMDHPSVAKVFDGGMTDDGLPYFVMELVKGLPITTHCDQHKLSLDQRIELFAGVCRAVQHAHGKGLIHRDLKPSNILVSYNNNEHTPKVIDFGIAKALTHRLTDDTIFTQQGQLIGTPEYMSPEQAEMGAQDIDTRTDIYSLGVVLYELLTGQRPFDASPMRGKSIDELKRVIREYEPPRPSTLLNTQGRTERLAKAARVRQTEPRSLKGVLKRDLDWVVMKCLEKDRSRRYETTNDLALELGRYLRSEPVLAGPPSVGYKLSKFVARNRAGVSAASVALLLLVGGFVGTSYGLIEARRQADIAQAAADAEASQRKIAQASEAEARARAEQLQLITEFQTKQLGSIDIERMGEHLRRSLLEDATQTADPALADWLRSINFTTIALDTIETNIFERTIDAIDGQFTEQPALHAMLLQTVSSTMLELGLIDAAMDPQRRALDLRRSTLGDEHPDTLTSINNLASLLEAQGKPAEAEPFYREALETGRSVLGSDHPDALNSINNMGFLLQSMGRLDEAEPFHVEALEARRRMFGEQHASTLSSMSNLAALYESQGRFAEAEPLYRAALEGNRKTLGEEHPDTLTAINNMGAVLSAMGSPTDAQALYSESLTLRRRVLGDDHPDTIASINNLAVLLNRLGRYDEAEPLYTEAVETTRRVLGDEHPDTIRLTNNMGSFLRNQGKLAAAEPYYRRSLAASQRVLGEDHPTTLGTMSNLALLLADLDRGTESLTMIDRSLRGARRTLGEQHWLVGNFLGKRGRALQSLDRFDEARAEFKSAHELLTRTRGERHSQTTRVAGYLAGLYQDMHTRDSSAGYADQSARWAELARTSEEP